MDIENMLEMLDEPVPPWDTMILKDGNTYITHEAQVSKANEVFGIWSYETFPDTNETIEPYKKDNKEMAKVTNLVRVHTKTPIGERSGCGGHTSFGPASGLGKTRENCFKSAETDALKRSLVNLGWALGLCLYDKNYLASLKSDDWQLFSPTRLRLWALNEDWEPLKAAKEKCRSRFERYAMPIINEKKQKAPLKKAEAK